MKTQDPKQTFNLEVEISAGVCREDEFWVPYEVEPFVPGNLSGPPERCYPDEGGYAEGHGPVDWVNSETGEVATISWERFLALWSASHGLKDDGEETPKHARKTAAEKAEDQVDEMLYELWEEEQRDREQDALERKVDRYRDDNL